MHSQLSQLALPLDETRPGHGGAREGAGRKRREDGTGAIPHRERASHTARFPVHVTLRAVSDAPSFRNEHFLIALHRHIAAACERGRRIVHFSLQDDHLHNIIEAADRENMARTIQGFASILARAFNRVAGRRGRLWEERYHRHDLRTPTEVHHALGYVLQNFRKHAPADQL
jgi:putative transposase